MRKLYDGKMIRFVRTPDFTKMMNHNIISWNKVLKQFTAHSWRRQSFECLTSVVKGHTNRYQMANNPASFITYCCRSGWLEVVK